MKTKLNVLLATLAMSTTPTFAQKVRFPKPEPEKVFAEYKIATNGNVLRTPREDWAGAKLRVQNDADWKAWLAKEQADIDDWMIKRRDRIEWVAGWYHDFVSPKNAARLKWTPEIPGENSLVSTSDASETVALTPKLFNAWVYNFRTEHGKNIERAAKLFRLTGQTKYADWAASQLDFYADNYLQWPAQTAKGNSRLMFQSLDEAVTLVNHLNAARTLGEWVTPERKKNWVDKLFRPQAELLNTSFQQIHNIATWQRAATAQVALYADDETLWKLAVEGKNGLREQLQMGITGDYLWYEQSLSYNSYVVMALNSLFTQALLGGRGEMLKTEMLTAQNLMLAPLSIRFPDGQLPTPADSPRGTALNRGFLASQYRIFPTTLGVQEAAKARNWNTLIDPPQDLKIPLSTELAPVVSRDLSSSRMALLRSGPWQVWFHYGQLLNSHAQSEALNFEAWYNDIDITHDAGTVGYGSPLHRDYYTRGLSHNVPLVDGEAQDKWKEGELIKFDAANATVSAAQPQYRPNARATRTLRIENQKLHDEATIETSDDKEHELGWVLHLQGQIRVDDAWKTAAPIENFAEKRPASFKYWKPLRALNGRDKISFLVDYALAKTATQPAKTQTFRVTIQCSGDFRLTHADVPDAPPRRRQAILLETRGRKATFTSVIEPLQP